MKVDVKIAGASYSEVPSILIPLKSGGKARFCEVSDTTAEPGDVIQGKRFYTSDGELVVGTADISTGVDNRKKVTLIQKDHQTITITSNPVELSSQTDTNGNTVYATEYQNMINIRLKSDDGYYVGKITVNGTEQDYEEPNRKAVSISVPISNGMIVSATDAILVPTLSFNDVNLTLAGQGVQNGLGCLFMTSTQSPDVPGIDGAIAVSNSTSKGVFFVLKGDQPYDKCTVEITTDSGVTNTVELSYINDSDFGAIMIGQISDALYAYFEDKAEMNAEAILKIKVVS